MAWVPVAAGVAFLASMFGKGRTVEYRDNPETQRQLQQQNAMIEDLKRGLDQAVAEAKKRSDPAHFRTQQKAVFQEFLSRLGSMSFVDCLPEQLRGARNVMVIGDVGTGKSSLLNQLFGLRLPVGIGHTTTHAQAVFTEERSVIWDTAGCNQDFAYYDPDTLNLIHSMALVVVLYNTSLVTAEPALRTACKIKGVAGVVCVRTMCDRRTAADVLTVNEETQRDRNLLADCNLSGVRVFQTSATAPDQWENARLRSFMLTGVCG